MRASHMAPAVTCVPTRGALVASFMLNIPTPLKYLAFGVVQICPRELAEDETPGLDIESIIRDANYRHPKKLGEISTELAAQCAVDRVEDIIEQIREDELEESGHFAKEPARISRGEAETHSTALSVKGSGEWALDSGSCFNILTYPSRTWGKGTGAEHTH